MKAGAIFFSAIDGEAAGREETGDEEEGRPEAGLGGKRGCGTDRRGG